MKTGFLLLLGATALVVMASGAVAQPYGAPPGYGYGPPRDYEDDCRDNNRAAGTIFGAIGGGLIGGAASHGNPGAVVGGVVLGGLVGNALAGDVDCHDHRYAFNVYAQGLNGPLGERYQWRHGDHYGYFTPTREYSENGYICRDFTAVSYRDGEEHERNGTACREPDGDWHFR